MLSLDLMKVLLTFLLLGILLSILRRKGITCRTYVTKKPDIVFEIKDKKYAIEVETGKVNNTKQLKEKRELCNKEYGKDWFFVVANKNLTFDYKKYGYCFDKRNVKKKILSICV